MTNWLTEALLLFRAKGRSRAKMIELVESELRDTLQEDLFKLFTYHNSRPKDVRLWVNNIEARRERFSRFNISVGRPRKRNLEKKALINYFVTELFDETTCLHFLKFFSREGYPRAVLFAPDMKKLRKLAEKLVDCILEDEEFKCSTDELL